MRDQPEAREQQRSAADTEAAGVSRRAAMLKNLFLPALLSSETQRRLGCNARRSRCTASAGGHPQRARLFNPR